MAIGEFMTEEHIIQNKIRLALSESCIVFRVNVGSGVTYDGRHFDTGVPKGFSDLFGFRKSDGKAFFAFLEQMRQNGAVSGICRSPEDALRLLGADANE